MKKALLTKLMLLLCALIAGSSSVWADEYVKVTSDDQLVDGDVYIIATSSAVATAYSNSSLTITGTGFTESAGTITTTTASPMEFTLGLVAGNYTLKMSDGKFLGYNGSSTKFRNSATDGTDLKEQWWITNNPTYSCYIIKNASSEGNRYIGTSTGNDVFKAYATSNLETYAPATLYKKKAAAVATPTFTPASGTFTTVVNVTITCTTGDATIYYTLDGSTPTSSSTKYTDAIPVSATTTIKAIAIKGGDESSVATATYTIVNIEHAGTKVDPYTVADARNAIDAGVGVTGVYATGIVSEIVTNYNPQYENITFNISTDGETTSNQLQAYRCIKGDDDADPDVADIKVGDEVVIKGDLVKYGETYEFAQNCTLISIAADTRLDAELAWSKDAVEIAKGATDSEYTLPTLSNPNNVAPITYQITGTDNLAIEVDGVILVDTDVEGSVTVTASFAGDATYQPAAVSYTITVFDNTVKGSIYNPYTVAEVIDGTATGSDVYVTGFIVGEYPSANTPVKTSDFTTDANVALADVYSASTEKINAIPVQLNINSLKAAWGNKTNAGTTMGYKVLVKGTIATYFSVKGIKPASEVTAIAATATITDAKYATNSYKVDLDFSETGVSAYTLMFGGTKVILAKIEKVPANTPIVIYKDVTETTSTTIPLATSTDNLGTNDLKVSDGTVTGGAGVYALANKSKGVGFYLVKAGITIPAGKCYLSIGAAAPDFLGFNDDATGIDTVKDEEFKANGEFYNLNGQRVAQPTKGLYIVNGKKVIIK